MRKDVRDQIKAMKLKLDEKSGMAKVDVSQRVLDRIPVDRSIFVSLLDQDFFEGRLKDLSGSGALLQIDQVYELGQLLELRAVQETPPFARVLVKRIATEGKLYGVRWIELHVKHLPKGFLTDTKI